MRELNAKTRYAIAAALDLAEHYAGDQPIKVQEIAARTNTPAEYLVHILLQLKRRALVNSTRGARGGYWLLRRPEMISVGEIVAAVERRPRRAGRPEAPYERTLDDLWERLARNERKYLDGISLADLLRMDKEG